MLQAPDLADTSWSTRQADAFANLVAGYLSGEHGHHVEHWSNGGETSLDNPVLLCTKHHTLVHEGGFSIEKDFGDQWYFLRPDGIAVPDCGYHSRDVIDISDSHDIPPRGGLLSKAEKTVSEQPPPALA